MTTIKKSGAALGLLLLLAAAFLALPAVPAYAQQPEADIFDLPGAGRSASANLPPLTILYNAMTAGEMHPCPTWGSVVYGGLARRAGFFNRYRELAIPSLIVAGPYEFLADDPIRYGIHSPDKNALPPAKDARVALEAYTRLNVDIGWLSKKSAKWLRDNAGGIPPGFLEVGGEAVTRLLPSPAGMLGFVLFPEGSAAGKSPTPKQYESALAAGRSLKGKAALVIGISPWGYIGERDFLARAEGVFDGLLGSGEGVGFPGTVPQKAPGLLWIRPDGEGRAVNILEVNFRPKAGEKTPWVERKSFTANLEFLDQDCPVDPVMQRIIGLKP